MKKIITVIMFVFIFGIITGCSLVDKIKSTKMNSKIDNFMKSYEIVLGVRYTDKISSSSVLYGYKNNELIKIDNSYPKDKSNFNRITGT